MIVGLTGGIGSGKTSALQEFKALGVPVYIADVEAKKLMNSSNEIKTSLINIFGKKAYLNEKLNRPFIANQVFTNKTLLAQLNRVVHPVVHKHFKQFVDKKQFANYIVYENAILFENKSNKLCDKIIVVAAPLEARITRVMLRDKVDRESVLNRINNQWNQELKIELADYVINNYDEFDLKDQVNKLHLKLMNKNFVNSTLLK